MPIAHMVAIENLQAYLETLPSYDTPEVFGLHTNSDISFSKAFIQEVLDTIIDIQPKDAGGGGGESREAVVTRMCDDMLKKLPEDFNAFKVESEQEGKEGRGVHGGLGQPIIGTYLLSDSPIRSLICSDR